MLKGHVFSKQIFGNPIFALFINTFLNGKNGVSNNYKNGMEIAHNGNMLTVQSGAVCIQGRFLEEDSSTNISVGNDTAFCKLVIEIDLDKQNTESDFVQGAYKIVKSVNEYPNLTQTDIVKNNAGIYQYELARFKTTINGITDFQDMRTFLDFNSIYSAIQKEYRTILADLKQELANVQNGSAYMLKNNITVLEGKITVSGNAGSNYIHGQVVISFPDTFDAENCVVIALSLNQANHENFKGGYGTLASCGYPAAVLGGGIGKSVSFRKKTNDMILSAYFQSVGIYQQDTSYVYDYKIVLMKI